MTGYPGIDGRTIVVTGAAGGLGAATARLLAARGARVVATDVRDADDGSLNGTGIEILRLDVTDEAAWTELAGHLRDELDGAALHGLVSTAGITHRARLGEIRRGDWDRVLAVNTTGVMLGMQALAPLMTGGSAIVTIGSAAALNGHYPVAYTTAKWALRGLTHAAATEYGPRGIRVNIIHPGFIETDMTAGAPAAMREAQLALTPLERVGQADEVAHLSAFLLSDAAGYISGAEIPVDGAFTSSAGAKYLSDRIAGR